MNIHLDKHMKKYMHIDMNMNMDVKCIIEDTNVKMKMNINRDIHMVLVIY